MKLIYNIILSLSFIFINTIGYTKPTPRTVFNKAEEAYFEDDLPAAAKLYQQVVKISPNHFKSHARLGDIYLELKQPDKAIAHLKIVMANARYATKELQLQLAEAYQLNYEFDLAITQYFSLLNQVKRDGKAMERYHKRMAECLAGKQLMAQVQPLKLQNLGAPINSSSSDHVPILINNDSTLVFTSRRPKGGKKSDLFSDEDVFYSHRSTTDWTAPVRFGRPLNSDSHEAVLAASADGKKLYLYRDNENGGDIYEMQKAGNNSWKKPVKLGQPLNSKYYEPSVFLSKDGNYAFFASDRPGGFGGLDIYLSVLGADGSWSEALNLGANVNTAFDEDAPFLNADNTELYFSSKGHQTMGGYDVFKSSINGTAWLLAQNLGVPVNSPSDDIFYVQTKDGKSAYLASDRPGGFGGNDIYLVQSVEDPLLASGTSEAFTAMADTDGEPALILPDFSKPMEKQEVENILALTGWVLDVKTGDTLDANITLLNQDFLQEEETVLTSSRSGFTFMINKSKLYSLVVEKDGYTVKTNTLRFANEVNPTEYNLNIELVSVTGLSEVFLNNIVFNAGKDELKSQSLAELDWLYKYLENNPEKTIAFTTFINPDDTNVSSGMKTKRLAALAKYLTSRGIEPNRIKIQEKERPEIKGKDLNNKNQGLGVILSQ